MAISKNGNASFGTEQADIRTELARYSKTNGYEVHHFNDCVCHCQGELFSLLLDEDEGVAGRVCILCGQQHVMLDGAEYLESAKFFQAECTCEESVFEVTVGVSLYQDEKNMSDDVRWVYIGCRCPACNLVGCYGDWKNEYIGYKELLNNA